MAKRKSLQKSRAKSLTLIIPEAASDSGRDRAGGELQSGSFARLLGFKKVEKSLDELKKEIAKLSDTVSVIANAIQTKQAVGFEVKSIDIGVAISAEGGIGIATAGVEASITVTLERK